MLKINMHNPHGVGSFVLVDPGAAIELQLDDVDAIEYESTLTFLQARSEFVLKFSPVFKGKGGESIEERDTWQLKIDAATASVAAGVPNDSAITMFHAEAEADSVTIMDKCHRAVIKGEAYKLLIGIASGIKTRAENAIKTAQKPVDVRTALIQAATEAQAAAAQYLQMIGANK